MMDRTYLLPLAVAMTVGCAAAPVAPVAPVAPAAPAPTIPAAGTRRIAGAVHVSFPSRDGDLTHGAPTSLDGWLFRPEGAGPFPAVIALHGCGGLYGPSGDLTSRHRAWAERLMHAGYVVLMPDSFSARGTSEICSSAERTIRPGYERARDVYGALDFIEAQPFVRADRVGLLGWSNGGATVLAAEASRSRARRPPPPSELRVMVAFYPGCAGALRRTYWLPLVSPLHILIGERDDWTPAVDCQRLVDEAAASGAPVDIVVYPDSFHDFDDPTMTVHTRHNVATTASHTATVGANPAARADAIVRVMRIFDDALGR
jgi:dienelactone hydrolase